MSLFSRPVRHWAPARIAAVTLGIAWAVLLAAFGYAAISVQPGPGSLVAAAAALLIAGAAILYAWREPGR
ncbi:MAG TPA: hypothetical protein VGX27_04540 [Candidatus Dormibacteraeota bacterium]|nr:hypothetical protein [Candidatus Dormibacteraeota bacterium]